ncbi:hypothetical protein Trydic_g4279 [Trypoxylus dichotomus]
MTSGIVIFYSIFPFFDEKDLPVPLSFSIGRYRYLMYLFQVVSLAICAWNLTSIDLLFVNLLGLAAATVDRLRERLSDSVKNAEKSIITNKNTEKLAVMQLLNIIVAEDLRECTILHIAILRYVDDIEAIFSFSLLIHYLTAIVLLCTSLLQLTTMVNVHSIQFLLSCIFVLTAALQSSLYHWFGNEVIVKSNQISEACYVSEWYKCDKKVHRIILILMMGSQKPIGVSIYKFALVSLTSFVTMLRWAYSFAALIRAKYISDQR